MHFLTNFLKVAVVFIMCLYTLTYKFYYLTLKPDFTCNQSSFKNKNQNEKKRMKNTCGLDTFTHTHTHALLNTCGKVIFDDKASLIFFRFTGFFPIPCSTENKESNVELEKEFYFLSISSKRLISFIFTINWIEFVSIESLCCCWWNWWRWKDFNARTIEFVITLWCGCSEFILTILTSS
jgi:hypothetical protein